MSSHYERPIPARQSYRLGLPPPDRRAAARALLARGEATLAAVAHAWFAGDMDAAKAEIYAHGAALPPRVTPVGAS
jgi:hypothetical protein